MIPMKSIWCRELWVPRWPSVHGTYKPRRRLGRHSVAACRGSELHDQAAFSASGANYSADESSEYLAHLGNGHSASNVQDSSETFPACPAAANATAANLQARHPVDFNSTAPGVTLNGTRSSTGNARDYLGVAPASGPKSGPMKMSLWASVTPIRQPEVRQPPVGIDIRRSPL